MGRQRIPVSVITVCYNNAAGLAATLSSLASLTSMPAEIVVIDGGSDDETLSVLEDFRITLPLRSISEPDDGIYDAMNKGRLLAQNDWVHYLNAGDIVWGEPYERLGLGPKLLPVHVHNEDGRYLFDDFVKHGGFGYCHQGIIFPRDHPPYRTQFRIAADLDLIIATFPEGLAALPMAGEGGVLFTLGGISSTAAGRRNAEVRAVLRDRLSPLRAFGLLVAIESKNFIPRPVRRAIAVICDRRAKAIYARRYHPE